VSNRVERFKERQGKARVIKNLQDEKAIQEAQMKKEESSPWLPENQELMKHGNIKEAAAVFSHEGFNFLIKAMTDFVEREVKNVVKDAMTQVMQEQMSEMFQGFTEGMKRSMEVATTEKIEEEVAAAIVNVKEEEKQKESIDKVFEDFDKHKQKPKVNLLDTTYSGMKVPRNHKGISWSKLNDDQAKDVIFSLIKNCEEDLGKIPSGNQFKNHGPDNGGAYQKIGKFFYGWSGALKEYGFVKVNNFGK
jgi:hypothetical protein